jgi:diguanylate cyclase (GGDEF)-like protein
MGTQGRTVWCRRPVAGRTVNAITGQGGAAIQKSDLDMMTNYLKDVLHSPQRASLDTASLSEDAREFGETLVRVCGQIIEMRDYASHLSKGDLAAKSPPPENEMASSLRALQSSLKHISWQAKQIASGDYTQKVSFMGGFAESFNSMVDQLRERSEALNDEMSRTRGQARELEKANSLFKVITTKMNEWIIMVDRDTGERLFANHSVADFLDNENLENQLYAILMEYAEQLNSENGPTTEEFSLISDDGMVYLEADLYPVRWYDHDAVACVLVDVTKERESMMHLEDIVYKDSATGVYSRHYGMKALNEWIEADEGFHLVFVDMDMLKYVNDVYGHNEGDAYIQTVADLLSSVRNAVVSRLGGDEFMVLLKYGDEGGRETAEIFEGLRTHLIESSPAGDKEKVKYSRSLSFGVMDVDPDSKLSTSDILSQADERMYEYKKAHRKERKEYGSEDSIRSD